MPAENPVHREAREKPIGNHGPRATTAFFGRLEHQMHSTSPAFVFQQHPGRTQKRRGVAIMPAGMHHARHGGPPGQVIRLFFDRQRIHIAAQPDRAVAPTAADGCHHAMAANIVGDVGNAHLAQLLHNKGRSRPFFQRQAGMGVQVSPPGS